MSVHAEIGNGRLATLLALRESLAIQIDSADEKTPVAALAKELRNTLAEIDTLEKAQPVEGSVIDELAKRRGTPDRAPSGRRRRKLGA